MLVAHCIALELAYASAPVTARAAPARQTDPVTLGIITVYLVKKYGWVTLQDVAQEFVWGAIAGEGDSLAAISGDLALGALRFPGIFADGRDLVKEVCRPWPGGDDPNVGVVGFAILGLVTELPIFKAVGVDFAVSTAKILMKHLDPALPLAKGVWLHFKTSLFSGDTAHIQALNPLLVALYDSLLAGGEFLATAQQIVLTASAATLAGMATYLNRFKKRTGLPAGADGASVLVRLHAKGIDKGLLEIARKELARLSPDDADFLQAGGKLEKVTETVALSKGAWDADVVSQ